MNSRLIASLIVVGGWVAPASADPLPQPQTKLTQGTLNTWDLEWQSIPVRSYFIQMSENLSAWQFVPVIELGDGLPLGWGFKSSTPRQFFRLAYTDIPTTDPDLEDFDGDGVASLLELKILGTNPLIYSTNGTTPDGAGDSDGDGIADALELHWYGNLTTMTATSDADGDGILDVFEAQAGGDPKNDQSVTVDGRSNFHYDKMGRLTDAATAGETHEFAFDVEGNVQTATVTVTVP